MSGLSQLFSENIVNILFYIKKMGTMNPKNINNDTKIQNQQNDGKNTWLKAVIEHKEFKITKIVDNCFVRAFLYITLPESLKEVTVTVWKDDYIGHRLSPWMNFQNKHVMTLLHSENIPNLNAVLTYTISGQFSLQERVNCEEFRHHNKALEKIMISLMEVTNGLRYVHKMGYAHMNIKASEITILKDDTIKIGNFQFLNPINSAQQGTSIIR